MKRFDLLVAPLEGYSERAFRSLCHKYGATRTFTEMARVESLSVGNKSTWNRVMTDPEVPTVVQLLPTTLDHLKKFLDMWQKKRYSAVEWNLNLGCPSPHIVNKGLGCAMMKRISKINSHIELLRQTGLPVSLKMRLGLNEQEAKLKSYMNVLKDTNADYYIIHARNGRQKGSDKPDWIIYKECLKLNEGKEKDEKIIIANGDIRTDKDIDHFVSLGVHGVMLGRVAVQNPYIFQQFSKRVHKKEEETTKVGVEEIKEEYKRLKLKYYGTEGLEHSTVQKYEENFLRHFANPKYKDIVITSG